MTDTPPTTHNLPAYSVSEVSQAVKGLIEDNFGHIRVRGEVSGFKKHSSGHLYFTLKDDKAILSAVCWKGVAAQLAQLPEDGLEVICSGRVTTYPGQSKYQIVVTDVAPAGVGALMALLEKRKQQLAAEGLFDESRKQPLPFMPQVIGVITSPTGAVIRDILHRITERFPVHVLVWPVAVQGDGAAKQVAAAIAGFNAISDKSKTPRPDLLIVARGGGSIEDLWPFNEEITVRAVATSQIPVISAIGHETDTTLVDYVADRRAPTPTAAAEMAVPVREEWLLSLGDTRQRLQAALYRMLEQHKAQLHHLSARLPQPQRLLEVATQRLDDWQERLSSALPTLLQRKQEQLQSLASGIRPTQLMAELRHRQQQLDAIGTRYRDHGMRLVTQPTERLAHIARLLESYHYRNVLKRGFVAVHGSDKHPLTRAEQTEPGQAVTLEFYDDTRKATLAGKGTRKTAGKSAEKQPSLFDNEVE